MKPRPGKRGSAAGRGAKSGEPAKRTRRAAPPDLAASLRARVAELEGTVARLQAHEGSQRILESRLRAVMASVEDSVTVTDLQGTIIYMNESGVRRHGAASAADVVGTNAFSLLADEASVASGHDSRERLLQQGGVTRREYLVRDRDGRVYPLELTVTLVRDDAGRPIGYVGLGRDVSDRRRTEQEREDARTFLDSIVENIPHMVFVKDARDLRFVRFNRAGEQLLGIPRAELIGKSDQDFFPSEQADFFNAKDRECLAGGKLVDIPRETIETRQGTRLLHTKKIPLVGPDGAPKFLLGIAEDITERVSAEEALRETERLRELDRLKTDFLSAVSHELRTPLVSLQGYVELLLKHDVERDKARQWLSVVLRSSRRLEGMINGLLDIAKLQSRVMRFDLQPVDVADLVALSVNTVRPQLADKGLSVDTDVAAPLPYAHADRQRILSVLLNLLENAIKFSRPGGVVRVRARQQGAERLVVSVQDQGIGIPRQFLDKVFTRFFQVHAGSVRPYGGSGIGLSLVKEIVEAHGGAVWAESTEGSGSTFFFTVPASTAAVGAGAGSGDAAGVADAGHDEDVADEGAEGEGAVPGLTVLVVDDDPDVRELMQNLLKQERCQTRLAANGEEGLEVLRRSGADLVLLDLAMPGLGGLEVCAAIRQDPRTKRLPVYILTAYPGEQNRQAARDAGADGFFEKPCSVSALNRLLHKVASARAAS